MKARRQRPLGAIIAGVALLLLGVIGTIAKYSPAANLRGPAGGYTQPSMDALRSVARHGVRFLAGGRTALAIYPVRAPKMTSQGGSFSQVLVIVGSGGRAEFFMVEAVGPSGWASQQRVEAETGWYIQTEPKGTSVPRLPLAKAPRAVRLRAAAWFASCSPAARPVAIWPFPSGALAVGEVRGQLFAAALPESGGPPDVFLSNPLACPSK